MKPAAPALQKPVAIGSALAWAMVGVPLLLQPGVPRARLPAWAAAWVAFGVLVTATYVVASARARRALLALAVTAVLAMVLLLCDGFEGALLVVVALRLAGTVPRAAGLAWVAAQTLLLGVAVGLHWSPSPALMLAAPYLGFGVLAFLAGDSLVALEAVNAQLRASQRLAAENSRLEERVRIARELHDAVGHRLTALGMNLEVAARLAPGDATEPIGVAQGLVRSTLAEVRSVVDELRDEDRVDLAATLRALAAQIPAPPSVHLDVPEGLCREDPARALALLRCAQEIVTNAARHARAENLWITITEGHDGAVELAAHDDGVGQEEGAHGGGLAGMRQRLAAIGGELSWSSARGQGFHLRALLPRRT